MVSVATKDDLYAVERLIASLSPKQKIELANLPGIKERLGKWTPNPGPQTQAYYCEADELFYGGQAGGGKTDLVTGLSLTAHQKSLVLRRTNKEATKLVERYIEIIGSRDGWNGQDHIWRLPDGKVIDISGCQHEDDKQKFKGTPHDLICVGRGTPVMLADGSFSSVEDLRVGQLLATLEGPKRLEKVYPQQRKQCVEVIARDELGGEIARQIQSSTHELLSENGLTWVAFPDDAYGSKGCRDSDKPSRLLPEKYASLSKLHRETTDRFRHMVEFARQFWGRQLDWGMRVCAALLDQRTYCEEFAGGISDETRPPLWFDLPRRPSRPLSLASLVGRPHAFLREVFGARAASLPQGLKGRCSDGSHPCGGRTRKQKGYESVVTVCQRVLLLRGDAGQPIPMNWQDDVREGTRKYNPGRLRKYVHPYTKEIRPVCLRQTLQSVTLETVPVGEKDVFDLQVAEVNHYITKGGFINKNCFDEVSDFTESQYRFISGWNRSADKNQRCRVVAAGNPPTTPEGLWVLKYWAPWLDDTHPNPAKPGELRWFTTIDGEDTEVDGPGPHEIGGELIRARSRTFIPAELEDNPDLAETNYASVLAALPEELRAAYKEGRFDSALKDDQFQVIPTAWIKAAQDRWTPDGFHKTTMTAMAFDPAGGGHDAEELIWRHQGWLSEPITAKGVETSDGSRAAGVIVQHRRHNAPVIVDVGGGYGGAVVQRLQDNGITHHAFNGANSSAGTTIEGKLNFCNKRTEAWWRLREALNPDQEGGSVVSIPPSPEIRADLAAPRWKLTPRGIQVESKDEIRKRLGRSPGKGDVIVMCLSEGQEVITRELQRSGRRAPKVILGYAKSKGR